MPCLSALAIDLAQSEKFSGNFDAASTLLLSLLSWQTFHMLHLVISKVDKLDIYGIPAPPKCPQLQISKFLPHDNTCVEITFPSS